MGNNIVKITRRQLRRIINEEFDELDEGGLLNKLLNRDNDIVDRQPQDQYSSEHDSYRNVQDELTRLAQDSGKDPKTILQEFLQGCKLALPKYSVIVTSGEAHQQKFRVKCAIPKLGICAIGEGSSRRSAEQEAAKEAYEQIHLHS